MQKARGKRHRQGLVLGMILVAGFMTGAWPALGKTNAKDKSGEQPRISVWVFNFARVPDSTLTRAENLATEIFRAAGVEIAWTNCNLATTDLPKTLTATSRCTGSIWKSGFSRISQPYRAPPRDPWGLR